MDQDVDLSYISPQLRDLAVPIESLDLLPGNPHKGNVEAVAASYEAFGQRKPIVARLEMNGRGTVLAGNTQLRAAREMLGWTHIACIYTEDDDQTGMAYALADNRTAELGSYDDELLATMIQQVEDQDLLGATGFTQDDLAEMLERIDQGVEAAELERLLGTEPGLAGDPDPEDDVPAPTRENTPVVQYTIIFENEEQQQDWYRFIRWLKRQYPEQETVGGRLAAHIFGLAIDET